MILTDTGPLVALILTRDPHRERVERAFELVHGKMVTTAACITEAMYFLGQASGWHGQRALGNMLKQGILTIHQPADIGSLKSIAYMELFQDQPCDYADATLLVAAEESGLRRIFTTDSHFYAYRLMNGDHLEVVAT